MADFNQIIDLILQLEGGYVNHSKDKMGATNMGITLEDFRLFGRDKDGDGVITENDLKRLTKDEAKKIYKERYWDRIKGDSIKDQHTANLIFDWAVHSWENPITELRKRYGIKKKGDTIDDELVNLINSDRGASEYLHSKRKQHIDTLVAKNPSQKVFYNGWNTRINKVYNYGVGNKNNNNNMNNHYDPSNRIKEFWNEFNAMTGGRYKNSITSNRRKQNKTSAHQHGDAIDLGVNEGLLSQLTSEKGIALMQKYGLGIAYENSDPNHPLYYNNPNATGPHYHIGPDFHRSYGGFPIPRKGNLVNVYDKVKSQNIGRVYSNYGEVGTDYTSRGNSGNQKFSSPKYDNNTKTMEVKKQLTEEDIKRLGLSNLGKANKKHIYTADKMYEEAIKKAKDKEEVNLIAHYFEDKGWIENVNNEYWGGMLNEHREAEKDKKFKAVQDEVNEFVKVFGLEPSPISHHLGRQVFVKDGGMSVKVQGYNIKTAEEMLKKAGINLSEKQKKKEYARTGISGTAVVYNLELNKEQRQSLDNYLTKQIRSVGGESAKSFFSRIDISSDTGAIVSTNYSIDRIDDRSHLITPVPVNFIQQDVQTSPDYSNISDTSNIAGDYVAGDLNIDKVNYHPYNSTLDISRGNARTPEELKEDAKKLQDAIDEEKDANKKKELIKERDKLLNKADNFIHDSDAELYKNERTVSERFHYDKDTRKVNLEEINKLVSGGLMGLMGVIKGNELAKTPLQLRDEKIQESYLDFVADLKKLSEAGLKPEEEAYAKKMLSESYQSGLDNVVRASAGNRNVVLGSLGRLDNDKVNGLLTLAMKDAEIKKEAAFKYGEAQKYISDFEAQKNIANNERLYQESLLKQKTGASLASEGFKSIISSIHNYTENAPGSYKDMMKSRELVKVFGYDPNETNPDNPNHISQYNKKIDEISANNITHRENLRVLNSLPPNERIKYIEEIEKRGYKMWSPEVSKLLGTYRDNSIGMSQSTNDLINNSYNFGPQNNNSYNQSLYGQPYGTNTNQQELSSYDYYNGNIEPIRMRGNGDIIEGEDKFSKINREGYLSMDMPYDKEIFPNKYNESEAERLLREYPEQGSLQNVKYNANKYIY